LSVDDGADVEFDVVVDDGDDDSLAPEPEGLESLASLDEGGELDPRRSRVELLIVCSFTEKQ
jgi:hypothetical protein